MSNEQIYEVDSLEFVSDNYVEYSKYLTSTRVYPSVCDGLKTVHRRCLYASRVYNKMTKTPAHVGEAIKIHPHGNASIESVINDMTCRFGKLPLYIGKGNFGGLGSSASSSRYTSTYLNEFARLCYLDLVDYAEYVEGEVGDLEPKYLPSYLPYSLIVGSSAISSGMPNPEVPSYNLVDLIDYYVAKLSNSECKYPRLDIGELYINNSSSLQDIEDYGEGRVYFEPLIYEEGDKLVIKDSTPRLYIKDLESKLSKYIDDDVIDYNNESNSEGYRITLSLGENSKDNSLEDIKSLIIKYMQGSKYYKTILEHNSKAIYCNLDYISKMSLTYLKDSVVRMAESKKSKLDANYELLNSIELLKSHPKILANLPKYSRDEFIEDAQDIGIPNNIAKKILTKPISYLTKSHSEELLDLSKSIEEYNNYIYKPEDYLLPRYERLRELALSLESSRHNKSSVYPGEISEDDLNVHIYYKLVDNKVLISNEGSEGYNRSTKGIYILDNEGTVRFVDLFEYKDSGEYLLLDNDVSITSDNKNYLFFVDKYGRVGARSTDYISDDGSKVLVSKFKYDPILIHNCDIDEVVVFKSKAKKSSKYVTNKLVVGDYIHTRLKSTTYVVGNDYGLDIYIKEGGKSDDKKQSLVKVYSR